MSIGEHLSQFVQRFASAKPHALDCSSTKIAHENLFLVSGVENGVQNLRKEIGDSQTNGYPTSKQ
jgi:hypothetical protein